MYACAKSEGFDVRRIHSDRGREFFHHRMKAWCSRHGLHKTYALPEEHQSNGRAEGAIMRAKAKARAILQQKPAAGQKSGLFCSTSGRAWLSQPGTKTPECAATPRYRFFRDPGMGGLGLPRLHPVTVLRDGSFGLGTVSC